MQEKYRLNVAAIIMDENYPSKKLFLLAKRSDLEGIWQFPQGGVDENESLSDALFRELLEEIGTNNLDLIASYPKPMKYDFPPFAKQRFNDYKGQVQHYFLLKLKNNKDLSLDVAVPEFDEFCFVDETTLWQKANELKKPLYQEAIAYFKSKGVL